MNFDCAKFHLACQDYEQTWQIPDQTLRTLVRKYPGHTSRAGIYAKILMIGRSYSSGIERQIKSKRTQGSAIERLWQHLWKHRKRVDKILEKLQPVREPLTLNQIATILVAHAELITVLKGVVRKGQTPRSFASKYLHFHNAAVPILDSIVIRSARKHYPHKRSETAMKIPKTTDIEYADYLVRFWKLYGEAQNSDIKFTVKLLDYYLLALAKEITLAKQKGSR